MIELGAFALLRPLWLLVLPALLLLLRFTRPRDATLGDWRRAIDAPLLAALLRRQGGTYRTGGAGYLHWSVALMALALAGPAIKAPDATQFRNLDASLVLLDVSKADNLPQAAAAAQMLLENGGARQMGLVLFAGDAYLASPLTDDVAALEALLFAVDDKTVPDGGQRPDRALAFARRILQETGAVAGDVALISDGGGVDAQAYAEARALAAEGHALHTFSVTSRNAGAPGEAALATLAKEGHGLSGDARGVAAAIADRQVARVEQGARRALEWRDHGRWLLLLAAAPLLLFFRARL